jgi:hypothetical protein
MNLLLGSLPGLLYAAAPAENASMRWVIPVDGCRHDLHKTRLVAKLAIYSTSMLFIFE